jgi:hypothetical protein
MESRVEDPALFSLKEKDLLNSLKERLDNDHLKFDDFQTMIKTNQQRIETLYEYIRNIETTVTNFNMIDGDSLAKFVDECD